MASDEIVERALKAIAAMYGKHPLWVQDSLKMWRVQLQDIDDRDLKIGVKDLLRTTKKLPTVAQLRDVIEANPTTKKGEPIRYDACRACDRTGMRQLSRWYINDFGRVQIWNGVAACDCTKGLRLGMGAFPDYRDIVEQWESNPATTRICVATDDQPALRLDQTMTMEDDKRLRGIA